MPGRGLFTSYRTAKKDVDAHFDALTKAGWTPQVDPDGKTYSWVNGKGETLRSGGDENLGVSAGAGWAGKNLKREARQDRLMRDKVSALLPKQPTKKEDDTSKKGGDTSTSKGPTAAEIAAESKAASGLNWGADQTPITTTFTVPSPKGEVPQYTKQPEKPIQEGEIPEGEPPEPKYDAVVEIPKQTSTQQAKKESAFGRDVPDWESKDRTHSRLVYVLKTKYDDPASDFNKSRSKNEKSWDRSGRAGKSFGAFPVSQAQVDWYNTVSDVAPELPLSGMNKLTDKYYYPSKTGKTGEKYILAFNPEFIPGRFDTKEGAEEFAKRGWGRDRPIKQFGDEYGVGTNLWDKVNVVGGSLDAGVNKLLTVLGLTPKGATVAGGMAKEVIPAFKELGTASKSLVSKTGSIGKSVLGEVKGPINYLFPKTPKFAGSGLTAADKAIEATEAAKKATAVVNPTQASAPFANYNTSTILKVPEWFKNTLSNAGKVTRTPGTSVPFDMRKCGGKLVPKRKMKGK